jgi:hypothetical protein
MTLTRISISLLCGSCLAISACGGGHGGGSSTPPATMSTPPPAAVSATVTGAAAKGLLLNAIVTFYSVTSGAAGTTSIASVRTDSKTGAFSSPVSSAGAVLVTLTTDSASQMLDEISGAAIPAPSGLVLHAVVDSLTNLQPIAVTPLTEMAYDIAKSSTGGLTTANIDAANNAVSETFLGGAPALYTQPIDLKNYAGATAAQQEQAKLLTAFAVAASEGTATDSKGNICAGSYPANIVCMISGLGDLLTLSATGTPTLGGSANYVAAAYTSINSGTVTLEGGQSPAALGLNVATAAETAFDAAIAKQAPLPGFNPAADPLANTKALFADIRTNIVDQASTQTFGYAPTLTALQNDFQNNVQPITENTGVMLAAAWTASQLLVASASQTTPNPLTHSNGSYGCAWDPSLFDTANNVAVCIYGGLTDQMLLIVTQSAAGSYALTTQALGQILAPAVPSSNDYFYKNMWLSPILSIPTLNATLTLTGTAATAQSAAFVGPFYLNASGGEITASLKLAESSDWNAATGSGSLSASGTLSNGSGGISLKNATIGTDSVIVVKNSVGRAGLPVASPGEPPLGISGIFDLTAFTTDAFSYAVKLTIGTAVADKSGALALPGTVTLAGSIDQVTAGGATSPLFSGTIGLSFQGVPAFDATQPISATNFVMTQVQLGGTLALTGGRVLTLAATANATQLTPTPSQPDSITVTYSYSTPAGMAELNATGQFDATNGFTGTVTNNSGVVATLTKPVNGEVAGTVTANGVKTATIDGSTIDYSDGSVESVY